jgi:hypothetical protein
MVDYKNEISEVKQWWFHNRTKYIQGLLKSGAVSILIYLIIWISSSSKSNFEEFLFGCLVLSAFFLIYILLANILYTIGSITDLLFNTNNSKTFRELLFACGYWISVTPPPLLLAYIAISVYYNNSNLPI